MTGAPRPARRAASPAPALQMQGKCRGLAPIWSYDVAVAASERPTFPCLTMSKSDRGNLRYGQPHVNTVRAPMLWQAVPEPAPAWYRNGLSGVPVAQPDRAQDS